MPSSVITAIRGRITSPARVRLPLHCDRNSLLRVADTRESVTTTGFPRKPREIVYHRSIAVEPFSRRILHFLKLNAKTPKTSFVITPMPHVSFCRHCGCTGNIVDVDPGTANTTMLFHAGKLQAYKEDSLPVEVRGRP